MTTREKIARLRSLMEEKGWDAAIISGSDPHSSEYISPRWQARKWISGFTGSFGNVVITKEDAGLWTDSRYFIQAARELEDSGIALHKMRIPGSVDIPQWLAEKASGRESIYKIAVDGLTISKSEVSAIAGAANVKIIDSPDYISEIWEDRPGLPGAPACTMPVNICGRDRRDKIEWLRKKISCHGCDAILLSSLDEIAWMMNIRGGDIDYNPLVLSYLVVTGSKAVLYTDRSKFDRSSENELLEDGIDIEPYDNITADMRSYSECCSKIYIDGNTLNYHLYNTVAELFGNSRTADRPSPVPLEKAIKNEKEIAGMKKAAITDGVVVTKFFMWLEQKMKLVRKGEIRLSEIEAAEKLDSLRKEAGAIEMSFGTISAYGKNAALPHYSASADSFSYLEPKGLYLVDSGGQYKSGTTDITRTIPLGPISKEEKTGYTLVLKGMIDLACSIFPKGTRGTNIDVLARNPLWNRMMNFGHGTGHGVGHILCVHEGPQAIRHNWVDCELLPGMITSDEPGLYVENKFGIRHENLLLCKTVGSNEFGEWYGFETVTYAWIDTSAVDFRLLSSEEEKWLRKYNEDVYRKLKKHLNEQERKWLKKRCIE